jgi:hypothetical protein
MGKARALVILSQYNAMLDRLTLNEKFLAEMFAVLPTNTSIVSITELPITRLSLDYEIEFKNPIFLDEAEIIFTYRKNIGFDDIGNLVEYYNLIGFNNDEVIRKTQNPVAVSKNIVATK